LAKAIVAYLEYKRDTDADGLDREQITAALEAFWLDRASRAPANTALAAHLTREAEEFAAIQEGGVPPPEDPGRPGAT
jgi:hypothetical protein